MFGGEFISCSWAVTWIDGTEYIVRASGYRRVPFIGDGNSCLSFSRSMHSWSILISILRRRGGNAYPLKLPHFLAPAAYLRAHVVYFGTNVF